MSEIIRTVSDIKWPRELAQIFDLFAQWLALSPLLKQLNPMKLEKIGIDDPDELKLLSIRTQKAFAEEFKVDENTLTNWKKKEELWEAVARYMKKWGKSKTPSVLAGFYRKAVSEGDAPRVKLWLQYFEDLEEKSKVKFEGASLIEMVRAAEEAEVAKEEKKDAK